MTALSLPLRSEAVARRIVELRAHWETHSPAWVVIDECREAKLRHVNHDTVSVELVSGELRVFDALSCEVSL